jgi:hypothetical protein
MGADHSRLETQSGGIIYLRRPTSDDIEGEWNGRNKREEREVNESNWHFLQRIWNPWLEPQEFDVEDLLDMSWP